MCTDIKYVPKHSEMCKIHKTKLANLDEYTLPKSAQMMYNICIKLD